MKILILSILLITGLFSTKVFSDEKALNLIVNATSTKNFTHVIKALELERDFFESQKGIACISMPDWCFSVVAHVEQKQDEINALKNKTYALAAKNSSFYVSKSVPFIKQTRLSDLFDNENKETDIKPISESEYYTLTTKNRVFYISKTVTFIKQWFESKGGKVDVLEEKEHNFSIIVNQLKSQIINSEKYWEQLEIKAIAYDLPNGEIKFHLLVDGRYASGLSNSPSSEAYRDIEPKYSKELDNFLKLMAKTTEDYLKNQKIKY